MTPVSHETAPSRASSGSTRVTVTVRSASGRDYLYDDITGSIFPWNKLREQALAAEASGTTDHVYRQLEGKYPVADIEAAHRFIRKWRDLYGAFLRVQGNDMPASPPAEELEREIRKKSFQILLILTEDCNLRCKYCALSEVYPYNRARTKRRMSAETARRAIDYYVALVEPQRAGNPRKRFGLSLYGGEPTMNMPVVRSVLDYCRGRYPGLFQPVMTTNGTALTPRTVEALVEHDVSLAISIDGPAHEHDRLRLDAHGRGSWERIARNLRRIKREHPAYWANRLMSLSVYDWATDVEAVEAFFAEHPELLPRSIFVNPVKAENTSWYDRYTAADRQRIAGAMQRLRSRYMTAKIKGEATSSYMDAIAGTRIAMVQLRRRIADSRHPYLPFSGSCLPGDKIAVRVDGTIDMCERVDGRHPIGHLDHGGIDYHRVREVVEEYRTRVLSGCAGCPVTRHCGLCFAFFEGASGYEQRSGLCEATVADVASRLADYISILEQNPRADFRFETDTMRLEESLLFGC